jgi:hypothetical protein
MNDVARYGALPVEELRDKVMDELVRQFSLERVDLDDFERRTDLVSKASTRGELLAQVADLPSLPAEAPPRQAPGRASRAYPGQGRWSVDPDGARASDIALAIFGGSDYKGVWRAPRQLSAICVFGGSKIDLREAIVPSEGLTISCLCLFGGVDVVVPPGMRVHVRGMGIFGGFDRTSNEPEDRSAPTVVVDGIALFGGVSVKVRE